MKFSLSRYATFDRCRGILPWFSHARARDPVSRFRRRVAVLEAGGKTPSALPCAAAHAAVGLRQCFLAWRAGGANAARHHKVSHLRQAAGLLRLCFRHNQPPHDYYRSKLWLRRAPQSWGAYVQHNEHMVATRLLARHLPVAAFDDKLRLHDTLVQAGVPTVPVLLAAQKGLWRDGPRPEDLKDQLDQDLFIKPSDGAMFEGVQCWRRGEKPGTHVRRINEVFEKKRRFLRFDTLERGDLLAHVLRLSHQRTILVQPASRNMPDLEALSPHWVANFRIMTASLHGRISTLGAVLRMSYSMERFEPGVYQSAIDLESGVLGPATGNLAQWGHGPVHLDTGARVEGVRLERWAALRSLAEKAHALFPWMPSIGWDILDTDQGPRVLEANAHWGADIAQIGPCPFDSQTYAAAVLAALDRIDSR